MTPELLADLSALSASLAAFKASLGGLGKAVDRAVDGLAELRAAIGRLP